MSLLIERHRMLTAEWEEIRANGLIQTSQAGHRRLAVRASRVKAVLRELLAIEKRLEMTPASRLKRRR
jgi:hypothetical protein